MIDAEYWIEKLNLRRHPEGGYFRETYRSQDAIGPCCLGREEGAHRRVSTAIFYLLGGDDMSMFHRIRSDEIWHFYAGVSLSLHVIDREGQYTTATLGIDVGRGEIPQAVVPAGLWFGATVDDTASYALVGCTVAPGFDFEDLDMGSRDELIRCYPHHRGVIERLTR